MIYLFKVDTNKHKKLTKSIKKYAYGIFKLNAPRATGYLLTGKSEVETGMFCERRSEIDESWDYYYSYTGELFQIVNSDLFKNKQPSKNFLLVEEL